MKSMKLQLAMSMLLLSLSCFAFKIGGDNEVQQHGRGEAVQQQISTTIVRLAEWQDLHQDLGSTLSNFTRKYVIVTITNRPDKAILNLEKAAASAAASLIVLQTGLEWPGNLMKIAAFGAVSAALPAETVIFFTDCCDVWLRDWNEYDNVFERFLEQVSPDATSPLASKRIVISAERGYTMLGHGIGQCALDRPHYHLPAEFPRNTFQAALGVADQCDNPHLAYPRCLQSKLMNAGMVIGFASSLADFYKEVWNGCERCQDWDVRHGNLSLKNTSEQNQIAHHLLMSKFRAGTCAIDYEMSLFHTTSGFTAADYSQNGKHHIDLTLPGGKKVPLQSKAVHAPGNSESASIMAKLRGSANAYWHSFLYLPPLAGHGNDVDISLGTRMASLKSMALPVLALIAAVGVKLYCARGSGKNLELFACEDTTKLPEIALAAAVFCLSASCVVVLNKDIMTAHSFPHPCFVSSMGVLGTFLFSWSLVLLGFWKLERPSLSEICHVLLPLSLCGSLALWAGNAVYLYLSVAMVQVLKAGTTLLTFLFTLLLGLETLKAHKVGGLVLVTAGMAFASWHCHTHPSLQHGMIGVGLLVNLASNASEAMRGTLVQLSLLKLSFQDTLCWGSPLMLGLNTLIVLFVEVPSMALTSFSRVMVCKLLLCMCMGCAVTVSGWWLTKLIGAVAVKLFGQCRNMSIIASAMLWDGEMMSRTTSIGYAVTIIGVLVFSNGKTK